MVQLTLRLSGITQAYMYVALLIRFGWLDCEHCPPRNETEPAERGDRAQHSRAVECKSVQASRKQNRTGNPELGYGSATVGSRAAGQRQQRDRVQHVILHCPDTTSIVTIVDNNSITRFHIWVSERQQVCAQARCTHRQFDMLKHDRSPQA
jgi:hypothetical protein